MGVYDGERFVFLPSGAIVKLLQDDRFTSQLYVPSGTPALENSSTMYTFMGLKIFTAQLNPNGGLGTATIGSTAYTTGFAFTREAIINETATSTPECGGKKIITVGCSDLILLLVQL